LWAAVDSQEFDAQLLHHEVPAVANIATLVKRAHILKEEYKKLTQQLDQLRESQRHNKYSSVELFRLIEDLRKEVVSQRIDIVTLREETVTLRNEVISQRAETLEENAAIRIEMEKMRTTIGENISIEKKMKTEVDRVEKMSSEVDRVAAKRMLTEVDRIAEERMLTEVERVEERMVIEVDRVEDIMRTEVDRVEEKMRTEVDRVEDIILTEVDRIEEKMRTEVDRLEEIMRSEVDRVETEKNSSGLHEDFDSMDWVAVEKMRTEVESVDLEAAKVKGPEKVAEVEAVEFLFDSLSAPGLTTVTAGEAASVTVAYSCPYYADNYAISSIPLCRVEVVQNTGLRM